LVLVHQRYIRKLTKTMIKIMFLHIIKHISQFLIVNRANPDQNNNR
jgi:hypothetical protein